MRSRNTDRLCSGKSSLVDAIVYVLIDPLVGGIDLGTAGLGIEIQLGIGGKLVELGIEHPDNLSALIVHDRLRLAVPQNGHGKAGRILGVSPKIEFADVFGAVKWIGDAARRLLGTAKLPALLAHQIVHDGHANHILQSLETAHHKCPVGLRSRLSCTDSYPGTGVRHIQVVAALFGREFS